MQKQKSAKRKNEIDVRREIKSQRTVKVTCFSRTEQNKTFIYNEHLRSHAWHTVWKQYPTRGPLVLYRSPECWGYAELEQTWKFMSTQCCISCHPYRSIKKQIWHPKDWLVGSWISVLRPFNTFRSFRLRSVNLATLLLGKPLRQFTST